METFIKKMKYLMHLGGIKKDIILLAISGVALLISIFDVLPLSFDAAWVAIVLCGVPIVMEAVIGLVTEFDVKADVLVSLALIASVCIGEDFAAGEVAFIMQIGSLLEELTVAKAQAGIERLVHLTPQTARVLAEGEEKVVPAETVRIGAVLRVLPGETVPVDGVILSGQTSVNQAVMTGESLPVDKGAGDEVSSGTVNQFGVFEMRATRVGEDSSIQRMIRLVQSADAGKARIVRLADRWATWIVVAALTAAVLTWLFSGQIIRSVTILVVFCPCALVLATPTAIMAAIGNATKHGFLVREGDALERLSKVSVVTFDKTGTLTYGVPQVVAVKSVSGWTEREIYTFAAAAERLSEHPLGKAVVRCYQESIGEPLPPGDSFQMVPGRGVSAVIDGHGILAGNQNMLAEKGIAFWTDGVSEADLYLRHGSTLIYLAVDAVPAGYLVLSDTVRQESASVIDGVRNLGIQPVLLTGDCESAAGVIAEELHIRETHADCLPEDKLKWIGQYREKGQPVCMIGDGINDAPALKAADVGIAMGGIGSDIAVDAADIALVDDEVKELPHLLALSEKMMTTIRLNLVCSMALNFIAIGLAFPGILSPVAGALVHNAGSVFGIIHSALLLKWRKK